MFRWAEGPEASELLLKTHISHAPHPQARPPHRPPFRVGLRHSSLPVLPAPPSLAQASRALLSSAQRAPLLVALLPAPLFPNPAIDTGRRRGAHFPTSLLGLRLSFSELALQGAGPGPCRTGTRLLCQARGLSLRAHSRLLKGLFGGLLGTPRDGV